MINGNDRTSGRMVERASVQVGDAAADGLLSGIVAGAAIGLVIVLAGIASGQGGLGIYSLLDPMQPKLPLRGLVFHFSLSGLYGAIFGLLVALVMRRVRRTPIWTFWLAGIAFGGILYLLSLQFVPIFGTLKASLAGWLFLFLHLYYGWVLGLVHGKRYN